MKIKKTEEGFELIHKKIITNFTHHLNEETEIKPYNYMFVDLERGANRAKIKAIAEILLAISNMKFKKEERELK